MAEHLEAGGQTLRIFVPAEIAKLTPDLQRFFDAMIYKLRRNKHKGRWEDIGLSECFRRVHEELAELATAIDEGSTVEIAFEAADVANFAMIIANVALVDQTPEPGGPAEVSGVITRRVMEDRSRGAGVMPPYENGMFEGDLWYGDPNDSTKATHRWTSAKGKPPAWVVATEEDRWLPGRAPPGYSNANSGGARPIPDPDDVHTAYEERRGLGKDVI